MPLRGQGVIMTLSERFEQRMNIVKKYDIKADRKNLVITYMDNQQPVKIKCEHELGMENMMSFLITNLIYMENHNDTF